VSDKPSDARSSLFRALQQRRINDSNESPKSLEQHLEMLFSDTFIAHGTCPSDDATAEADGTSQSFDQKTEDVLLGAERASAPPRISRRLASARRLSGFWGIAAILVLIGALFLNSQVRPLEAHDSSSGPQTVVANEKVAEQDTPTPRIVVRQATRVKPTIVGQSEDGVVEKTSEASASPTVPLPEPEPTIKPGLATATVRRGESVSTVHPSATPAKATPTPTYRPASQVNAPTATSVPAYLLGLGAIPTPVPRISLPEHAISIVLLGSDQRPFETGWRTDVIIVVSVDPDGPSVSMVSIPRDTWLYIPNWTYQRINMADSHGAEVGYPGGGPGLVKATIEYNFGVHIDYFARVDFAGLINIVDALGRIDVLLECPVEDGFPDDPITEDPSLVTQISYPEPGVYEIDGKHALWLSRSRKTTSEFARSRRQHRVLLGIWNKAKQLGFIGQLPELWDYLTETVETDLSLEDVLWLASLGMKLDASLIHSEFLDGRHLSAWVTPGGGNVLLPHTDAILAFLEPHFNPYRHKATQGYSRVEVLNGSGHPDWGLLAADRLLGNGFEIVDISQTDETPTTTILDYTSSSKGSAKDFLEQLFSAESVHAFGEATFDLWSGTVALYRVVIGQDYQPCDRPAAAQWMPTPTPAGDATED
jgi:LCP family protein required for cell wall assembly